MNPIPLVPVLVAATAYAVRVRTLRGRRRAPGRGRQACFYAGIAALLAALLPPIDTGADDRFWVHMSQHLLLGDIAPLLVVLGLSGAVLRPLLAAPAAGRLRALGHPLPALVLWAAVLSVWHLSGPYDAALRHDWLHALEHASFFGAGALMWAAVVEPLPGPAWFGTGAKALYTLAVRVTGAVIASAFIWSNQAFYTAYSVQDQRTGGLIMFSEGGILTLVVFGVLFMSWMREAELRQSLLDQGHDPQLARRTARHWPRLRQPPGRARPSRSAAAPGTRVE